MQSLWLWVSNRGEQHSVGTRFCVAKSSVLYLLRPLTQERGCPTPDSFLWQQKDDYLQAREACGYSFFGCRWCDKEEVCDRSYAASPGEQEVYKARRSDASPHLNTTMAVPTTRYPEQVPPWISLCSQTNENASPFPSADAPYHLRSHTCIGDTVPLCPQSCTKRDGDHQSAPVPDRFVPAFAWWD